MKKHIIFALLLTIAAQGAWAYWKENYDPKLMSVQPQKEGPWEFKQVKCGLYYNYQDIWWHDYKYKEDASYNSLNKDCFYSATVYIWQKSHPSIYQWNDGDGIGFTCFQKVKTDHFCCVFSVYNHEESVPSFTRIRLRWNYSVAGKSEDFNQNVALYAHDNLNELLNTYIDILPTATNGSGAQYLLSNVQSKESTNRKNGIATFDFNNLKGGETAVKTWYIMLTHSYLTSEDDDKVIHWGAFRNEGVAWDTTYYKIVSFDANGGSGYMKEMGFETSDVVPANTFVRDGYTFQGWATLPNGIVRYNPGGEITATLDSKGRVTLYAVWKPQPATVVALIDAIGEVVYTEECKANIDAAREAYDALSGEEKAQVTNYSTLTDAETLYNAVDAVVTAINAIGAVQYSDESRTLIDEAQAAYDALTDEQKALVVNYNVLSAAQDMYDVLRVIDKIDAIGVVTYTSECKALIDDARAAYDALLTLAQKSQVTNYATLLAAEAAYAAFGKKTVLFMEQDGTTPVGDSQLKSIEYPALPAGASEWQSVKKDASDKTIVIKAVE